MPFGSPLWVVTPSVNWATSGTSPASTSCSIPLQAMGSGVLMSVRHRIGLKSRVKQHVAGKDSWNRAVLVRRDTTHGFNSAHVGWLEGHIYQLLTASASAAPSNIVTPSDESLAEYELHALQMSATGVMRTLRLLGYEPAAPEDVEDAHLSYGKKHTSSTKLVELIRAGLLSPDEELTSLNSLWPATAMVTESGKVVFNGESYDLPSPTATR